MSQKLGINFTTVMEFKLFHHIPTPLLIKEMPLMAYWLNSPWIDINDQLVNNGKTELNQNKIKWHPGSMHLTSKITHLTTLPYFSHSSFVSASRSSSTSPLPTIFCRNTHTPLEAWPFFTREVNSTDLNYFLSPFTQIHSVPPHLPAIEPLS